ncbi:Down syndrome cell adhesion molecule-like protein [Penaeus vannamei]|uniref:Down syndrome cell adhesion molecule-like protein n=1 Tax=Penaeus vannamei TaxID=6689 RepID=A0A3R7MS24_PENVA|nr:Down syndrome cell adhesion molecule-like protein [Penaeus vannamei]
MHAASAERELAISCHVIAVPPKLSIFTFRRDLALGERVYEACTVIGGDKPVQVTWTKDGVPVKSVEGVQVRNLDQLTTFLVIDHLSPRHAGNYTCTATNDASSAEHTSALNVNVPHTVIPFSFGEVSQGERVQAICSVRRGDAPVTLTWLKDGVPLSQDTPSGLTIRPLDQFSSVLLLANAQAHHSGNYTCQASSATRTAAHSATLVINVPPSWIEAPRDTSVTLGGSVVIPCHAHGFPAPVVTWRRTRAEDQPGQYSQILGGGHGLGVSVASNGSLVVVGARSEDEAQYLCEAVNEVGGGLSALVSLTVNVPPRFDPGLQRQVSVRRGARATLLCHAQGDPPITLLWQAAHTRVHDLSVVREVDGGVRGELTIPAAKMEDAGDYTCTASNSYGRDSFVVTLVVQDVPGSPHGLRVSQRGSRYLVVSWLPPTTTHTPVDTYIVQYRPARGTWSDGQEETVRGETTTARLTPLVPDTQYLVRVLAANHLGASPHSSPCRWVPAGRASAQRAS